MKWLEDLQLDMKEFKEEHSLEAATWYYGAQDGTYSINDVMMRALLLRKGYNRAHGYTTDEHWVIDFHYIIDKLPILIATYWSNICADEPNWEGFIVQVAEVYKKCRKEIADAYYCVYGRIKELNAKRRNEFFTMEEIMALHVCDECDYQETGFVCPYMGRAESCICDQEKTKRSLEALTKQGVLEENNGTWRRRC